MTVNIALRLCSKILQRHFNLLCGMGSPLLSQMVGTGQVIYWLGDSGTSIVQTEGNGVRFLRPEGKGVRFLRPEGKGVRSWNNQIVFVKPGDNGVIFVKLEDNGIKMLSSGVEIE